MREMSYILLWVVSVTWFWALLGEWPEVVGSGTYGDWILKYVLSAVTLFAASISVVAMLARLLARLTR